MSAAAAAAAAVEDKIKYFYLHIMMGIYLPVSLFAVEMIVSHLILIFLEELSKNLVLQFLLGLKVQMKLMPLITSYLSG